MPKDCATCATSFSGWGPTCASCRKTGTNVDKPCASTTNACESCQKPVYAMEKTVAEGLLFHITCFKCKQCGSKLSPGKFSRAPGGSGGFYCPTHYKELFRLKGRYEIDEVAAAA